MKLILIQSEEQHAAKQETTDPDPRSESPIGFPT